ncbi:MAG: prolipoprotein diacylglyceryl transferase [Verrucomicrobia bacterium]|nr:prolipoprotein diacylglyceryl transferase [Verrucomicrobiota bacterium]
MTFPVYVHLAGLRFHPHPLLEGLGYFVGARLYFKWRRRSPQAGLPLEPNLWLLVGCLFGAWLGSKLLAWAETPAYYWALRHDLRALLGGKTIAGGLLGGWAGVELAKRCLRLKQSTGDLFVYPLAIGTAIGRVGCFLTGLDDRTYGVATTLPWGVDFGDGVHRHPTQLYESVCVLLLALTLWLATRRRILPAGVLFRLYLTGYFGFRFLVEFIKPRETPLAGLSAIQLASLVGVFLALRSALRLAHPRPTNPS